MTTIASGGALQGREEVALSPSLPLFLALSHITTVAVHLRSIVFAMGFLLLMDALM